MASDDQTNPYARPSHWPSLPHGTMRLGPLPKAATPEPKPAPEPVEAEPVAREPVTFEPEAVEPAAPPTPAPAPGPYAFFGPTSRSTHPPTSPAEALRRRPEAPPELTPPAPPEPEIRAEVEAAPADIGDLGDLD
ncbi:MAG: hypothetical protein ACREEG_17085, partial [Phenylobacterium sp.]